MVMRLLIYRHASVGKVSARLYGTPWKWILRVQHRSDEVCVNTPRLSALVGHDEYSKLLNLNQTGMEDLLDSTVWSPDLYMEHTQSWKYRFTYIQCAS